MTNIEIVYNGLRDRGIVAREQKLARGMKTEEYICDGWTYTFYFCEGKIKKIEAGNGIQLIEQWN
jgi:hypothetical protein